MEAFFQKIDKLRPIYDWTYRAVLVICKILLVGDILITSYSVLGRYISFIPDPAWTEEVVLTFMCYMAVLSAALAIRKKSHIRMTALDRYLPDIAIKILDIVADLAVFALAVVMIVTGWQFASTIGSMGTYVSIPSLSRFWKYFPIPVAGVAMLLFEIESIYGHVRDLCLGSTDGKEAEK